MQAVLGDKEFRKVRANCLLKLPNFAEALLKLTYPLNGPVKKNKNLKIGSKEKHS